MFVFFWDGLLGGGSAGPGLRSQGSSEEDGAFALRAGGGLDRFQCSLRPDPAAAGACVVGGYLLVFWDRTLGFTLC